MRKKLLYLVSSECSLTFFVVLSISETRLQIKKITARHFSLSDALIKMPKFVCVCVCVRERERECVCFERER